MGAARRIVGVDESGKGDFFGPLVIASFLAPDSDRDRLSEYGVRDGKKISNNRVLEIADYLSNLYPHEILVIPPAQYNKQYLRIKNLNKLLAAGHARVIVDLLKDNEADQVVVDQFGKTELIENEVKRTGMTVDVHQQFRGEDVFQVAAASILARAAFIRELDKLSEKYDLNLPKGAAPIVDEAGRAFVRKYGTDELANVAKIHFKNYKRATDLSLFSR